MLNTFYTYESFLNKYTASYGGWSVTLIKITLKLVIVTNTINKRLPCSSSFAINWLNFLCVCVASIKQID